jgi:hypothetical protein
MVLLLVSLAGFVWLVATEAAKVAARREMHRRFRDRIGN